jgi:hypothetical protein
MEKKMKSIFKVVASLVLLLLFSACGGGDDDQPAKTNSDTEVTIDVSEYSNINNGFWEWEYDKFDTQTNACQTLKNFMSGNQETYSNNDVFTLVVSKNEINFDTWAYSVDLSQGLYEVGRVIVLSEGNTLTYDQSHTNKELYDPAVPRLLTTFVPGKAYQFETDFFINNSMEENLTITLTIEAEAAEVVAGQFDDCYKSTWTLNDGSYQIFWFAKNVGIVKMLNSDGESWELKTYHQ